MASVGENKVFCPYCGAEMQDEDNVDYILGLEPERPLYWYRCTNKGCGSTSPTKDTWGEARTAAKKRHIEPNRVLMLDEMFSTKSCFVEWKDDFDVEQCRAVVNNVTDPETWKTEAVIRLYMVYGRVSTYPLDEYLRGFRCWLRIPTEDEKKAAKWLPEKKQEDDDDE